MAIYAVGDIQGCYAPLARLLDKVNFDHSNDTLLCVGDLINRGPNSLKVVNLLKSLNKQCVTVLGNHDIHLLSMIYGIRKPKPSDTVSDILRSSDCADIAGWLRHQPLLAISNKHKYAMSHAGIYPWWGLDESLSYAREVETLFRDETSCIKLLKNIYGNTPSKWSSSLKNTRRHRFIINAFTRMRFCSPNGNLNLTESGFIGKSRKNRVPWFEFENKSMVQHRLIFGHWAALGLLNNGQHLGLDTGCVWGRHLTLAKIPRKPDKLKPIKKSNLIIAPNLKP